VTLEDKQAVTQLPLAAGATIGELNTVRKHSSRFKGGLLARAAWPATVLTLASRRIGDPLDVIASGPTVPDPTRYADALSVLELSRHTRAPPRCWRACKPARRARHPRDAQAGRPRLRAREQPVVGNNRARRRMRRAWRPRLATARVC
jgi:hydroxypyruvate reductase